MNKQETKKWLLLLSLLGITLILAWQAPEDEPQFDVVKPKPVSEANTLEGLTKPVSDAESADFLTRQASNSDIDLFDTPEKPKPIQPKIVQPSVSQVKQAVRERIITIPFKYIGRIEKNTGTTLFLMEDSLLHLAQPGDVINAEFKLVKIDNKKQELEWLYLPSNKTLIMSMAR